MWNELEKNIQLALEVQVIKQRETETKQHLNDANYNGELHFHCVCECDFIDSTLPHLENNNNKRNS